MFKNSTELLDHVLRELQVALNQNGTKPKVVKIVLEKDFTGNIYKACDKLEIKTITEMLREEFKEYEIESCVDEVFDKLLTFRKGSCKFHYNLIWTLTLKKK